MGAVNAPDVEIVDYAAANGFTVLAQDLDFGAILAGDELGSGAIGLPTDPQANGFGNKNDGRPVGGLKSNATCFRQFLNYHGSTGNSFRVPRKDSMTNQQLYLAIGVPMLFNAILIGLLVGYINAKFDAVNNKFDAKFDGINKRFDDMRDLWRAELRRVEEVLDARLKHLEEYAKH